MVSIKELTSAVLATLVVSASLANDRPNIVLIMVDDMGWSNIGCYGGLVETPHLDRLAEQGIRFNQFYNGARCCPTRATLMTGLHPHQAGVGHMTLPMGKNRDWKPGESRSVHSFTTAERSHIPAAYQGWLDESIPTLPEMLKVSGYATYMTGKWHLANRNQSTWPLQRGFDRFYGHLAGTSDFFEPANLYRGNTPIEASGERYYITDAVSDEAIGFLGAHDEQSNAQPFFLYLAYNAPHFPMQCMPEEYEKYRGRFMAGWDALGAERLVRQKKMGLVPENTRLAPRPEAVPAWDSLAPEKQNEMDAIMSTYAGMIDRVDQNVGKLVRHLTETGELDNTLMFFLSDNGGEAESGPFGQFEFENLGQYGQGGMKYGQGWATLSNTPFREYKHFTHQGGIQTPLIVHWPQGISAGPKNRILPQYGYLPDIVETCLDVAGASRPEIKNGQRVPQGEGVSLLSTLQGDDSPIHREPICIEHEGKRVVRDGKWKLVAYPEKPWELFDLDDDRSESRDLVGQHSEIVSRLESAYTQWADRSGVVPWETARHWSVYGGKDRRRPASNERQKRETQ